MRIGLFGFYWEGNFGDDLMALLAAAAVRRLGHEPVVAGLAPELAQRYGIARVATAAELVAATDRVVLGGGGLLTGPREDAGGPARHFAAALQELVGAAEAARKPLWAWSLGGDGQGSEAPLKPGARRLLESSAFVGGTVRRLADVPLLEAAGKPVEAFPDVVLTIGQTRSWLNPPGTLAVETTRPAGARRHVLLGLGDRREDRWPRWWLRRVVARWPGVAVGSVALSAAEWHRDRKRWPEAGRYRIVREPDPVRLLDHLAAADLVVAYRLHLGLAAWSLGTPFLACCPRPKVAGALAELGAGPSAQVGSAAALLVRLPGLLRADRDVALHLTGDREAAAKSAHGHFDALARMLAS